MLKDWLFLQFVAYATDCFRCDLQERGYLFQRDVHLDIGTSVQQIEV